MQEQAAACKQAVANALEQYDAQLAVSLPVPGGAATVEALGKALEGLPHAHITAAGAAVQKYEALATEDSALRGKHRDRLGCVSLYACLGAHVAYNVLSSSE
jgi:hypothetical protein